MPNLTSPYLPGYSPATSPLLPYNSPRGAGTSFPLHPQPASPANVRQHPARSSGGKLGHKIPLISAGEFIEVQGNLVIAPTQINDTLMRKFYGKVMQILV